MAAKFKQIKASKAKIDIDPLVKCVKETVDYADGEFAKTYRTFSNKHKPKFKKVIDNDEVSGKTTTSGDGSKKNPYPFVERGTKIRYATMTPDFTAKTTPRVVGSGPGSGGVAYVDKRRPRPGIEAREFEAEITKSTKPKFKKNGKNAMREVAEKSGHKI